MKLIITTTIAVIINIVILITLLTYGNKNYVTTEVIPEKVLDTAIPLNVTIDTDFLSKF